MDYDAQYQDALTTLKFSECCNERDIMPCVPTDRLLELFADAARRFGLGSSGSRRCDGLRHPLIPSPPKSPRNKSLPHPEGSNRPRPALGDAARSQSASADRSGGADVGDDDPDIRATTAIFLGGLSPELAAAATQILSGGDADARSSRLAAPCARGRRRSGRRWKGDRRRARRPFRGRGAARKRGRISSIISKSLPTRICRIASSSNLGHHAAVEGARPGQRGCCRFSPARSGPSVARRRPRAFAPPRRKRSACWRRSPATGLVPARGSSGHGPRELGKEGTIVYGVGGRRSRRRAATRPVAESAPECEMRRIRPWIRAPTAPAAEAPSVTIAGRSSIPISSRSEGPSRRFPNNLQKFLDFR